MAIVDITIDTTKDTAVTLAPLLAMLEAFGGSVPLPTPTPTPTASPTPSPTPTPTPVSTNVYPLTMPATAAGAPVTLGQGSDEIVVLAANFNSASNIFAIAIDGVVVAAPLTVTSNVGESASGSQVFTIKGGWGPSPHTIQIIPVAGGENGIWVNGVTYDFLPYVFNGKDPQSFEAGNIVNAEAVWDNLNVAVSFTPPIAVVPVPTPTPTPAPTPATQSVISASINGTATAGTLAQLTAATLAGETLVLPVGTFVGTALVGTACTITGNGIDQTIFDGTNLEPVHDKACLVPTLPGVTIQNMTIQNFAISASLGQNASSVRDDGPGMGCTLVNVKSTKNQDGLLTSGGSWTLTGCVFENNGAGNPGSGATHEMYFGTDTNNVVTLTNVTAACGPLATHALKSRAKTTVASGCSFTANFTDPTTGGNAGSVVDIPDCGIFTGDKCTINLPSGSANTNMFTYGEESANNAAAGLHVALTNCVFADGTGTGGGIVSSNSAATLDVTGSTYTGAVAPNISGWASVTGTISKAA